MEEENPLLYVPRKTCSNFNRRGRPKNENLVKFGPQPRSHISQMLKNIKDEKESQVAVSEPRNIESQNDNIDSNENFAVEDNGDTVDTIEFELDTNGKTLPNKLNTNKTIQFFCDYPKCKYTSKLSSNLIKHKRTHTMEKPYLCDLCSFRSNFVNSLKVHKRIHTNERPYSCKHCNYRCNSSSNLKKHCKHRHWDVI